MPARSTAKTFQAIKEDIDMAPELRQKPGQSSGGTPGWPIRDEATRLLSAAAHLDSNFATSAIREFLSEPLRATAPSPGVDAAAVLREAVAARTRRRWRDGVLAVLLLGLAVDSPLGFGIWLAVAALWKSVGPRRRNLDGHYRPRLNGILLYVALGVGAVVSVGSLGASLSSPGADSGFGSGGGETGFQPTGGGSSVRTVFAILIPLAAAIVLLSDRVIVWTLLTKSFRRGQFSPQPASNERMRRLGTTSENGRELLRRATNHAGNVAVYLGDKPFVGYGSPYQTWSITIPLEPAGEDDDDARYGPREDRLPAAFRLSELYDHIGASLEQLRRSAPALSPSYRLSELEQFETLVVPAVDLVAHYGEPAAGLVLPNPYEPPRLRVDPAHARTIAEGPIEWMRYYRGFRVESWDRDLVVSLFIHIGADRDMLYFECTPCVLPPIYSSYRRIDELSATSQNPAVADAVGSLLALPVSMPIRLWSAFRRTQPRRETPGELRASRYGARHSLRELGAQADVSDYLKGRDVDRYLTLIEDRIFRSTAAFLKSKGISSTRFEEKARIVQNLAYNFTDSTFTNSAFGSHSTVKVNSAGRPAPADGRA
jgi:hypothetical protein